MKATRLIEELLQDLRYGGSDFYYSCYQSYAKQIYFVVRTQNEPMTLAKEVQRAIWQIAPDTSVFNVMPVAVRYE